LTTHLWIITGTSRGVGAALAEQLLQPGHALLTMARHRHAGLQATADEVGVPLTQWTVDLAEPGAVAEALGAWLDDVDPATLAGATLINNAGVVSTPAPLGAVPLAELSNALRVGLEAALLLSAAFLQSTREWTAARQVLNISSGLGRRAMAGSAAYCAAKAGMDHFTRAMALEQAALPNGARVESMAPGVIDTDMQVQLRQADAALFPERERFAQLHAQGQLMSPAACAARLIARLKHADFGREPVTDIRG